MLTHQRLPAAGLTSGLSRVPARRGFVPVHDRGRVLADTAVLIADGGRVLSDPATLRDQAQLFGPVASDPTLWRALNEIGETERGKIARFRAGQGVGCHRGRHGQLPTVKVAGKDLTRPTAQEPARPRPVLVVRLDATLLEASADHIEVLTQAITQIPARYRRDLLITADGAGASHGLVDHITTLDASPWRTVHYSIGWELGARERAAIDLVPAPSWGTVLDDTGRPRDLHEAGLTALLRHRPPR